MVYRDRVVVCVLVAALLIISGVVAQPPQTPVVSSADENKELIAAALKLTKEAAGKYEFALEGAEEPAQRLLQMRELAAGCAVTKRERDDSASELRLLPQPIYRYEAAQAGVIDGAIFVFVQGTDPDLFLLLEARESGGKAEWQFAACRMN